MPARKRGMLDRLDEELAKQDTKRDIAVGGKIVTKEPSTHAKGDTKEFWKSESISPAKNKPSEVFLKVMRKVDKMRGIRD